MFTTPTVVGDVLFIGSCSGVVYGIDKEAGSVRWRYDTREDAGPAQFHGDPAVVGDVIVTGSDTAEPSWIYAFSPEDGEIVWKRDTDVLESDIAKAGGLVFGQTFFGDYVALDAATGDFHWRLGSEERRCGRRPKAPATDGQRVYVAAPDGSLKAVRASDGAVIWSHDLGCASTELELWRDRLWAGTGDELLAIEPKTGEVVGRIALGGPPHGRPAAVRESLVVQVGRQEVVAVDAEASRVLWRYRDDDELSSPRPHSYESLALVGDAKGSVHALDPVDGSVVWTVEVRGTVRGIGSEPGALYVGTLDGVVYRVSPPSTVDAPRP